MPECPKQRPMKTNCVELKTVVPGELADEFLKKLAYVSEAIESYRLVSGNQRVEFVLHQGFEEQAGAVGGRISEIADKLCHFYRPAKVKVLARQDSLPSTFDEDPHRGLLERGDLMEFGRGRYGFGPRLVNLLAVLDDRIKDMATHWRAVTHTFPSMIGADVLDRCKYIRNFPSGLSMVTHLREDLAVTQEFVRSATWDGHKLSCNPGSLSEVECLLSPSVCFHLYRWLSETSLKDPLAVTALGKCFRYESSNLNGLERLWDFTMREVIFVGSSDYVLTQRDAAVQLTVALLNRLGIAYEISTATDPFFVDSYAVQAAFQQGFDLKFEVLAPLPYSGRKLAVGSFNYHQDFFGRSFDITWTGTPAHTSCVGFGLERLALAFIAQHGFDESRWPR